MKENLLELSIPLTDLNSNQNENEAQKEEKYNIHKTSFLSKLFYTWTMPLFKLSKKNHLNLNELNKQNLNSSINKDDITSPSDKISYYYYDEKSSTKGKLFYSIIKANLFEIIKVLFFSLSLTSIKLIQITVLRRIIILFGERNFNNNDLYYISGMFIFLKILQIILGRFNETNCQRLSNKASSSLTCFIYNKLLTSSIFIRSNLNKGKLNTFIQNDVETIHFIFNYAPNSLVVPFQILISMYMLFSLFGYTFIYSFILFIFLAVISWIVEDLYYQNQKKLLFYKDSRVKLTNSILHMLKMIKMFTYENLTFNQINEKRESELNFFKKIQNVMVLSSLIHWMIPFALSVVSIGVYTYIYGNMKIENILVAIEIYDSLAYPLYRLPIFTTSLLGVFISMKRIERFLNEKDIEPNENINHIKNKEESNKNVSENIINFKNVNIGVFHDRKIKNKVILLENLNLEVKNGEMVYILGETGSGKTSLAHGFLGHYDIESYNQNEEYKNEINGKISYASQIPFIFNDTIKNNIIFYNHEDEEKYSKVIEICQLDDDISSLPGLDYTEISSNGTNLSGGQKSRINLARAVYNDADLYIFDNPLAALDAIISKKIYENVFIKYLKDKTRILFINDVKGLENSDRIIYLENGKIVYDGLYKNFIKTTFYENNLIHEQEKKKKEKFNKKNKKIINENNQLDIKKVSTKFITSENIYEFTQKGKLIENETQSVGKITATLFFHFFKSMGNHSYDICILIFGLSLVWQFLKMFNNYWLIKWSGSDKIKESNIKELSKENYQNYYNFLIYCLIGIMSLFSFFLKEFLLTRGRINTSRILHNKILKKLLKAPINTFHDVVPLGQIINVLNTDLEKCKNIVKFYGLFVRGIAEILSSMIICYIYNKYSLICIPFTVFFGLLLMCYYIKCGRDISRVECIAKTPIYSCYNESINGIISLRAFNKINVFKKRFIQLVYNHYKIAIYKNSVDNWYLLNLELCNCLYLIFIVVFSNINHDFISNGEIGLLLKYSLSFCDCLLFFFEQITNLENEMVHYERCINYTNIIQENYIPGINNKYLNKDKRFEINEPSIKFYNYTTKYRPNTEIILNKINIVIKPYEKIGIVGRSGSGKSSLINALFRIIEPIIGKIYIDGKDISNIPLKQLRHEICIVPQEPFLLEGTLKFNLDPYNLYNNSDIINVLKKIEFEIEKLGNSKKDILNFYIEENGNNLSLGEKQLICFARTILQKRKIVIFDEATADLDKSTENILEKCIYSIFNESTLLIIAHKLSNVMKCDKIIVMDNAKVIEFDEPKKLYENNNSMFRQLCNSSDVII